MSIRDELRRILTIISDLTDNDTNTTVKDTQIIVEANRPSKEVDEFLNGLQSLEYIKEYKFKPADADYKLYQITKKGKKEIYNKESR
jgi:predicted transcriptional regulator